MNLDKLQVDNTDFLIAKQIEYGPHRMMIRELTKNALEAVISAPKGRRLIKFTQEIHYSVPKLCIHNTGTGMSSEELWGIGNLACRSNKHQALDANFGEGAKVAALRYNSLGMIYTSVKDGIASRMWLAKSSEGYYGRVPSNDYRAVLEVSNSIVDVSDEYSATELANDWTQVVLLGHTEDQNTVTEPYLGEKVTQSWLAEELYHRFYRIDPSIRIDLHVGHNYAKKRQYETFETIDYRRTRPVKTRTEVLEGVFSRSETVALPEMKGAKVHYIYDEKYGASNRISSSRTGLQTDVTFSGIIYKDELYSFYKGNSWTGTAYKLGISHGASFISILMELPDDYPLQLETYRTQLFHHDRTPISVFEFDHPVINHRPQWLIDIINEFSADGQGSLDDVMARLRNLMNQLVLTKEVKQFTTDAPDELDDESSMGEVIKIHGGGHGNGPIGPQPGPKRRPHGESHLVPGQKPTRNVITSHPMFKKPHLLYNEQDVMERGIAGKAAIYSRGTNELFVNMLYPTAVNLSKEMMEFYPLADQDILRAEVKEAVANSIVWRVGSTVVRALSKQTSIEWPRNDVDKALTPECLSVAVDDDRAEAAYIKSQLGAMFKKKAAKKAVA